MGAASFAQFFLLTLYMQQVLHYSALQTGLAYLTLTLAVIVFANVAQLATLRAGVRKVLPLGLVLVAAALVSYARLPVRRRTTSGISSPASWSAGSAWR